MRKIGIMGGTFNPIHMGHLALGEYVMDELALDEGWYVPTGCSYMKSNIEIVQPMERYEMTRLAVLGNDRMRCMDVEIRREGYTYTYETLEQLTESYPDCSFYFIYGADCLFEMENWRCPERIFARCTIVACTRNGASIEKMQEKIAELEKRYQSRIRLLPFYNLEISSTELRERIASGKSVRYLIPDQVISYIEEKGFYQNEVEGFEKD